MPPLLRSRRAIAHPQDNRGVSRLKHQNKKSSDNPPPEPAQRRSKRAEDVPSDQILPPQDDPESILRKARKASKLKAQERGRDLLKEPIPSLADLVSERLEAQRQAERQVEHHYLQRSLSSESTGDQLSDGPVSEDPEQAFNYEWGYLPPFDEETALLIEAIMADPDKVKRNVRLGPEKPAFEEGLRLRNVSMDQSSQMDPCLNEIKDRKLDILGENEHEKQIHGQLWDDDRAECKVKSNEAFFQRTMLMSVVGRHYLIYKSSQARKRCLDFSIEEAWTCPPMPTRAYYQKDKFLTAPKPDLTVCFRKDAIIPPTLWQRMPRSMANLICYNDESRQSGKAFHFLTIEGKKAAFTNENVVAQRQCLNNASQSLHNMYEFFCEADHKEIFYEKVRFFSAVATPDGLLVRIHRAEEHPDPDGWIVPQSNTSITPRNQYPLRFEYDIFAEIGKHEFERRSVLDVLEQIIIGYGVNELLELLKNAATSIKTKFPVGSPAMDCKDENYYRYGQIDIPGNIRQQTPNPTSAQSMSRNASVAAQPTTDMPPPSRPSSIPPSIGSGDASMISAPFSSVPSTTTITGDKRSGESLQTEERAKSQRGT